MATLRLIIFVGIAFTVAYGMGVGFNHPQNVYRDEYKPYTVQCDCPINNDCSLKLVCPSIDKKDGHHATRGLR